MKQLTAKVSPEEWQLLDKFDCSRTHQMCRQDELIYSHGLMDGIMFCYWVERVGRGVEEIIV